MTKLFSHKGPSEVSNAFDHLHIVAKGRDIGSPESSIRVPGLAEDPSLLLGYSPNLEFNTKEYTPYSLITPQIINNLHHFRS